MSKPKGYEVVFLFALLVLSVMYFRVPERVEMYSKASGVVAKMLLKFKMMLF